MSFLENTPQKKLGYRSLPSNCSIEKSLDTTICIDNDLLDKSAGKHVFLTYQSSSSYLNEIQSDTDANFFTIIRIG